MGAMGACLRPFAYVTLLGVIAGALIVFAGNSAPVERGTNLGVTIYFPSTSDWAESSMGCLPGSVPGLSLSDGERILRNYLWAIHGKDEPREVLIAVSPHSELAYVTGRAADQEFQMGLARVDVAADEDEWITLFMITTPKQQKNRDAQDRLVPYRSPTEVLGLEDSDFFLEDLMGLDPESVGLTRGHVVTALFQLDSYEWLQDERRGTAPLLLLVHRDVSVVYLLVPLTSGEFHVLTLIPGVWNHKPCLVVTGIERR